MVVGLLWALNPGVVGVIVLLLSRPRGVQNLFAFWCGSVMVSIPFMLIPLLMLYFAPSSISFAHDFSTPTSPVARNTQIGLGLFTLSVAIVVIARHVARRRRASLVTSPQVGNATEAPAKRESAFRRLWSRAYKAWEDGSLWISFLFGMTLFPGPPIVLFVVTTITASGAGIGLQITAAIVFVAVMLAVVEIILVSYLVAPTTTKVVLRPIADWSRAYRLQFAITLLAVIGFWQLARGLGVI